MLPISELFKFLNRTQLANTLKLKLKRRKKGIAYYDQESKWCAHREYGLWFSLRAVVIFDLPFIGEPAPSPEPVLTAEDKEEIRKWTAVAQDEGWQNCQTLLNIRRSCQAGKQFEYHGHLLEYFYPVSSSRRDVLLRIFNTTE